MVFTLLGCAVFVLLLLQAGLGDLARMRIPNRLVLVLLLGYAVLAPLSGFSLLAISLGLGGAAVVFGLGLCLFACGWMGGGDVKLMAVVSLWLGLPHLGDFLLWTSVFGGLLTLGLMICRARPLPEALAGRALSLRAGETRVPYGVAIAAAGLFVFASTPWTAPLW